MFIKLILTKFKNLFNQKTVKSRNNTFLYDNVEFVNSEMGEFSYIAKNSIIHNCKIGKFCSIGPSVTIGYGDHPTNHLSTSPVFYTEEFRFSIRIQKDNFFGHSPVEIGNDVWIGAGVFVKNGVTIGDGAIIGAHSVVLSNVEAYSIHVGVPAKLKSYRFDNEVISKLKLLKWWDLPEEIIQSNINLFTTNENLNERIEKILKLTSEQK